MILYKIYIIGFYIIHIFNLFKHENNKESDLDETIEEVKDAMSFIDKFLNTKMIIKISGYSYLLFNLLFCLSSYIVVRYNGKFTYLFYILIAGYVIYIIKDFIEFLRLAEEIEEDGLEELVDDAYEGNYSLERFIITTVLTVLSIGVVLL